MHFWLIKYYKMIKFAGFWMSNLFIHSINFQSNRKIKGKQLKILVPVICKKKKEEKKIL